MFPRPAGSPSQLHRITVVKRFSASAPVNPDGRARNKKNLKKQGFWLVYIRFIFSCTGKTATKKKKTPKKLFNTNLSFLNVRQQVV